MSSQDSSRFAKTLDQILAEKKAAKNAERRAKLLSERVASGDVSAFLRKGETLAFPDQLEPHQIQAVLMTVRNYRTNVPTLNASDVGMGKTREAASFVTTVGMKRVLWLTFKNLVPQAVQELNELDPNRLMAVPIEDQSNFWLTQIAPIAEMQGKTVIYVTNYEVIHRDAWLFKPSPNHKLPLEPTKQNQVTLTHVTDTPGNTVYMNYPLGADFPVSYANPHGYSFPDGPQWDCIIVDEATKLRNGASYNPPKFFTKTKQLLHLCHPEAYKLFLTATPSENRAEEIWAYMNLFKPERFHDLAAFRRVFEARSPSGERVIDVERLLSMLGSMVIRHTVKNLGLNLPSLDDPKWFTVKTHKLHIDPESHVGKAYLSMQEQALAELSADVALTPKVIIEIMLRLRQLLSAGPVFRFNKTITRVLPEPDEWGNPVRVKDKQTFTVKMEPPYTKHDAVEELIASLQSEGEQVIVMSCFNQPLENLHASLSRTNVYTSGMITGETKPNERTRLIREFQQGNLDVLLVNKLAAAHGLNLQKCKNWKGGASHIIHMDRWWNPARERQANGRIVRMNTIAPCTAHYFEVQNSMDTAMRDLVEAKERDVGMLDVELMKDTIRRSNLG